jgi:hypothetical protein
VVASINKNKLLTDEKLKQAFNLFDVVSERVLNIYRMVVVISQPMKLEMF